MMFVHLPGTRILNLIDFGQDVRVSPIFNRSRNSQRSTEHGTDIR